MNEGWGGEEYFIKFSEMESEEFARGYSLDSYIEGYELLGIKGWNDFILLKDGQLFSCPTVPIDTAYIELLNGDVLPGCLQSSSDLKGKIKWYIKPLIFGGSVGKSNEQWVDFELHMKLVNYWNNQYKNANT